MCGIVGIARENSQDEVFDYLKKLEYRGHDSWGVATHKVYSDNYSAFLCWKRIGSPSVYCQIPSWESINRTIATLGHTRWASHGKVSISNCHPHRSKNGRIQVAHNGTFDIPPSQYEINNLNCWADSDTKVIANVLGKVFEKTFSLYPRLRRLDEIREKYGGDNAAVILPLEFNSGLFATANGNQTLAIVPKKQLIISDINAVDENCEYFILENGSLYLNQDGYYLIKPNTVLHGPYRINNTTDTHKYKNRQSDLMWHEINDQWEILPKRSDNPWSLPSLDGIENLLMYGCGSSYYAALLGKRYINHLRDDVHVDVEYASEIYKSTIDALPKDSVVVPLSQSGETIDVLTPTKLLQNSNYEVWAITNTPQSKLTFVADRVLELSCGLERAIAATKTFTAQCLQLLQLASNDEYGIIGTGSLPNEEMISEIEQLASQLTNHQHIICLGSNFCYPIALEAALKFKEVANVFAEGMPSDEVKHGPISLVDNSIATILFSGESDHNTQRHSNAQEIKARGGHLIGVGFDDDKQLKNICNDYITVSDDCDMLTFPIIAAVHIQILTYFLAKRKGLDPARSRACAKAVTV